MEFRKPYDSIPKTGLDYSNIFVDVFEEIPPYSIDVKTGEFLNKTNVPVFKKVGVRNIQEDIQSYHDDCNIYKILERVALSGDESILRQRVGSFGDFVNLPDNINDFNEFCAGVVAKSNDPEVVKIALNQALTDKQVLEAISTYVQKQINSKEVVVNE